MRKIYHLILIGIATVFGGFTATAQCSFTTTVPYYEGFNSVAAVNQMPNCGWWATGSWLTFAGPGNKYAAFTNTPAATSYFYSNGIYLNAGITYSASVWYSTASSTFTNWTNFTLWLATSQTTNGLTSLASTNGPAISLAFSSISNTFAVSASGIYYIAVSATGSGAAGSNNLRWDDLSVTIPCALNPANVSAAISPSVICAGQSSTLIATGASSYTWNTGSLLPSVIVTPNANTVYSVSGTNTLTGCTAQAATGILVNPVPQVAILSASQTICLGSSINLLAYGANTYTWSNNLISSNILVTPVANTSYSVVGANQFGCRASAVQTIQVVAPPQLTVSASAQICNGDATEMKAMGATDYTWTTVYGMLTGSAIVTSPTVSLTYTVLGMGINGCTSRLIIPLSVNACLALEENQKMGIRVFPNPVQTSFALEGFAEEEVSLYVLDFSGRLIYNTTASPNEQVNISELSPGAYILVLRSGNRTFYERILKE